MNFKTCYPPARRCSIVVYNMLDMLCYIYRGFMARSPNQTAKKVEI